MLVSLHLHVWCVRLRGSIDLSPSRGRDLSGLIVEANSGFCKGARHIPDSEVALDGGNEMSVPWRGKRVVTCGPSISTPRPQDSPPRYPAPMALPTSPLGAVWHQGPGRVAHPLLPPSWASPPHPTPSLSSCRLTDSLSRMITEISLPATVARARCSQQLDQHTQVGDSEDSMGSETRVRERNTSLVSPSPSSLV